MISLYRHFPFFDISHIFSFSLCRSLFCLDLLLSVSRFLSQTSIISHICLSHPPKNKTIPLAHSASPTIDSLALLASRSPSYTPDQSNKRFRDLCRQHPPQQTHCHRTPASPTEHRAGPREFAYRASVCARRYPWVRRPTHLLSCSSFLALLSATLVLETRIAKGSPERRGGGECRYIVAPSVTHGKEEGGKCGGRDHETGGGEGKKRGRKRPACFVSRFTVLC